MQQLQPFINKLFFYMNRLYPNCIPVIGSKNIIFHDMERQAFKRFPKTDFFDNTIALKIFDIDEVNGKGLEILNAHQFLMTSEESEDTQLRTTAFYKWKHPSKITNAIIELSSGNELICPFAFSKLMQHLDILLCKHVVLKIKSFISCNRLKEIMDVVHMSEIHSFQLVVPYELEYDTDDLGTFIMQQPKLKYMLFENAPDEKNLENKIFFVKAVLKPGNKKHPHQFHTNVFLFAEAQYHHAYFNRKLFIGEKGEIKNAPECEEIHGWIQTISESHQLELLIKTPAFQKLWFVNKERCEVCRDCEYRYMCLDNRVPYQHENGYWYHQQACNYDPYEGEWNT